VSVSLPRVRHGTPWDAFPSCAPSCVRHSTLLYYMMRVEAVWQRVLMLLLLLLL
jgi:hypothetical protein